MSGRTALGDPWIPTSIGPMPSGYFSVSAKFPMKNGNRSVNDCRKLTKKLHFMVTYTEEIYINMYVLRF